MRRFRKACLTSTMRRIMAFAFYVADFIVFFVKLGKWNQNWTSAFSYKSSISSGGLGSQCRKWLLLR